MNINDFMLECMYSLHVFTKPVQHVLYIVEPPAVTCIFYRMKEVDIGDSKALLVRQNGEFSAIGHKCTHYGAPLAKGYLGNGRVRCPWHGACFNTKTGDIEEFPGLDNVPCFQVN